MIPTSSGSEALRKDLAALVSNERASTEEADRIAYARDLWPRQQIATRMGNIAIAPPAVIVWPSNVDEVSAVVKYAASNGVPIVPYGAGSGVCGGVLPTPQTVVIDMKQMRAIRSVDEAKLRCDAQAGIIGQHLEDGLNARGFTLGHFPSSIICSSLGGWVAGRSAGQCSGRYGKIEDMVTAITCVDGRGEILRCERDGENAGLLPMIIGSEGILGVVTDAEVRISPAPADRRFASWLFDHTEDGLDAIRQIYQAGLRPAVARLYDPFDAMISRSYKSKSHDDDEPKEKDASQGPGLGTRMLTKLIRRPGAINKLIDLVPDAKLGGAKMVLMWEDDAAIADAELAEAKRIVGAYSAKDTGEGPGIHWLSHRHSVSYRQSAFFAAGAFIDTMEVAATWSRLMPMYKKVRAAISKHVFVMAHFSHAYPDGASIYFTFVGSAANDKKALLLYDSTWRDALSAVHEAGGSLSHHHGVGRSKAPEMRREQGVAIDVVQALKSVMDPAGVFNPGALIPLTEGGRLG